MRIGLLAFPALFLWLVAGRTDAADDPEVDFASVIKPILEANCIKCHGAERFSGDLRLDTKELALTGGVNGKVLHPGRPEKSTFYSTTVLPEDDPDVMPPKGRGLLSADQAKLLRTWIKQGAKWPEGLELTRVEKAEYSVVSGIFQTSCISCHGPKRAEAGLRLDARARAMKGGTHGKAIIPFDDSRSLLYSVLTSSDSHKTEKLRFFSEQDLAYLRAWIQQGANWPDE